MQPTVTEYRYFCNLWAIRARPEGRPRALLVIPTAMPPRKKARGPETGSWGVETVEQALRLGSLLRFRLLPLAARQERGEELRPPPADEDELAEEAERELAEEEVLGSAGGECLGGASATGSSSAEEADLGVE